MTYFKNVQYFKVSHLLVVSTLLNYKLVHILIRTCIIMCSSTVRLILISSLGLLVRFLFWLLCPGSSCLQTRWLVIVMVIGYVWLTVLQWMTLVSLPFSHFLVSYPTQQPGLCSALLTMGGFSDCDFFPVFLMISVVFCSDGVRNSPVTCASAGVVSLAQLHTIPHQMS